MSQYLIVFITHDQAKRFEQIMKECYKVKVLHSSGELYHVECSEVNAVILKNVAKNIFIKDIYIITELSSHLPIKKF